MTIMANQVMPKLTSAAAACWNGRRAAEQDQERREGRSSEEGGDRELADHDREGQERAAEDGDTDVREDDPEDDGRPAGAEALRRFGQGVERRSRRGRRRPRRYMYGQRQDHVRGDEEDLAAHVAVGKWRSAGGAYGDSRPNTSTIGGTTNGRRVTNSTIGRARGRRNRTQNAVGTTRAVLTTIVIIPIMKRIAQRREEVVVARQRRVGFPSLGRSEKASVADEGQEEVTRADDEDEPPTTRRPRAAEYSSAPPFCAALQERRRRERDGT